MEFEIIHEEKYIDSCLNERIHYKENVEDLKGSSSASHLTSAAYDWRVNLWYDRPNAHIIRLFNNDKTIGFIFLNKTNVTPCHWTLVHFVIYEEYRGDGHGITCLDYIFTYIINNSDETDRWFRMFSAKPSIGFYEKLGFEWLGISKTGLPYTFTKVLNNSVKISNELFKVDSSTYYNEYGIESKLNKQFKNLKIVYPLKNDNSLEHFFG